MILQSTYAKSEWGTRYRLTGSKGFTIIELLIVVAIMATMAAVALPSFLTWSATLRSRDTALGLSAKFKLARATAVTKNLETRVELDVGAKRFRVSEGNSASGSTVWTGTTPWVSVHEDVGWSTGAACDGAADLSIVFKPNGSSDGGIVCVEDAAGAEEHSVLISAASGRVRVD